MIVSHEHKFVFAEIPKNASRSVAEMLIRDYDAFRIDAPLFNHPKIGFDGLSRHSVKFEPEWKDYFYFAVFRNPFDRAASIYRHIKSHDRSNVTFEQIANQYFTGDWICCHDHACMVYNQVDFEQQKPFDLIFRFEQLEHDLQHLPFINRKIDLPEIAKSSVADYDQYYNSETKRIVSNWAKEDFDRIYKLFV